MGKGKISRFEDLKTFENVIQTSVKEVMGRDFHLKGKWASAHFGNDHPVILELGCGKGEYSVGLASICPGKNFIGVDIKGARMWNGAKQAIERKIINVAFLRTRIEFISSFFDAGEVEEIWLTFPDPQLKKRRHKKRLSAAGFLNNYAKFLVPGGIIHLKTDSRELYLYTRELVRQNRLTVLKETQDLYSTESQDPIMGIRTFYEKQFIEQGLKIHYLKFRLPSGQVITEPEMHGE